MDEQAAKALAEHGMEREKYRGMITALLLDVGKHFQEWGVASLDLHQGHDVHAFYQLFHDPSKVIHVQGYPGMSSDLEARFWARMMDYHLMMDIRNRCDVSIGNEHEAAIQQFPNFYLGVEIPYDSKALEAMLAANVPELMRDQPGNMGKRPNKRR